MILNEGLDLAKYLGHTLVSDPLPGFTKGQRYSCVKCWKSVLEEEGQVFGSALEKPCER
jgi:hypothetical protein